MDVVMNELMVITKEVWLLQSKIQWLKNGRKFCGGGGYSSGGGYQSTDCGYKAIGGHDETVIVDIEKHYGDGYGDDTMVKMTIYLWAWKKYNSYEKHLPEEN